MEKIRIFFAGVIIDGFDCKVNDCEGESDYYKSNNRIQNSIFGFFDFAGIASRGHVADATDNNEDDGDNTSDNYKTI